MKYLKFVFENEEVKDLITSQTNNIEEITKHIIEANMELEEFVLENIELFTKTTSSLADISNNIKTFIVNENIEMYNNIITEGKIFDAITHWAGKRAAAKAAKAAASDDSSAASITSATSKLTDAANSGLVGKAAKSLGGRAQQIQDALDKAGA